MKKLITLIVIIFYTLIFTAGIKAHYKPNSLHNTRHAINLNWCGKANKYCEAGRQAWNVAGCETGNTYSIWASNGQYVNIFQMGYSERKIYGWHVAGSSFWLAAKAAHRYYVASGKDWSPWSCKP